jgi:preprotein translocase subunit SecA
MLTQKGIPHTVLNAKYHMREAEIVAQAGRYKALTISTNMAGRGTDVLLGGNAEFMARAEVGGHEAAAIPGAVDENTPEYREALAKYKKQCEAEKEQVVAAGGLHILGTERHESRRIDNQLRGRSGRQGDKGSSRFYLSLEDDLLRIFGAERITGLMERLGMEEDVPIEHGLVNKAIENAQRKVEGHNFDIRKNLLDYDDVMNQQRKAIYALRKQILEGRYSPMLTEAEEKKGKTPPPPADSSGDWTVDSLAENKDGTVDPYRTDATAPPTEGRVLDPEKLTHELYRQFGAVVDVKKELKDRNAVVDKAARTAAGSLIQQRERVLDLADEIISNLVWTHCPEKSHAEDWDLDALAEAIKEAFNLPVKIDTEIIDREVISSKLWEDIETWIKARETELGPLVFFFFARHFYLEEIDAQWIDHLKSMDQLREGIGLRGYGQKDPKIEYKKEGFEMFRQMMDRLSANVSYKLFRLRLERQQQQGAQQQQQPAQREEKLPEFKHKERRMVAQHASAGGAGGGDGQAAAEPEKQKTVRREAPKVGRNEPCPCGSGKKYKKCHGATAVA